MKRVQVYAMAIALVAGCAVRLPAQTYAAPQSGLVRVGFGYGFVDDRWGRDHRDEMRRVAEDYGFRDGQQDGRSDFLNHRGFRGSINGAYRNADHGYDRRFGDRERYRDIYREAYRRGYEEGFRGHGRWER